MPTRFWVEVDYSVNYLMKMIPTKVIWDVTPLEKLSGIKPLIKHIRTFEYIAWDYF
jgi:hypothetical protein